MGRIMSNKKTENKKRELEYNMKPYLSKFSNKKKPGKFIEFNKLINIPNTTPNTLLPYNRRSESSNLSNPKNNSSMNENFPEKVKQLYIREGSNQVQNINELPIKAEFIERKKRVRTFISNEINQYLMFYFSINMFPDTLRKKEIADKLHLNPKTVQIWFQNQRRKVRCKTESSIKKSNHLKVEFQNKKYDYSLEDKFYKLRQFAEVCCNELKN